MTKQPPLVSIIIPVYNRREEISACLKSLATITHQPLEIIVVDDCSQDDTVKYLQSHFPKVLVIAKAENSGASASRSQGAVTLESAYYEGSGNVVFTWTKNQDADFGYYKLAVSETDATPSYPDNFSGWASSNRDQISLRKAYYNLKMSKGKTYYVAMSVRDTSGNVSTSNVLTVTIPADAPSKSGGSSKTTPAASGKSNMAYASAFRGGVRVATAEFCTSYIITAPGPGGGPNIKIWDSTNTYLRGQFMAYEPSDRGGVNVAAGDVDGDGHDELVVAPATNNRALVKIYDVTIGANATGLHFASRQRTPRLPGLFTQRPILCPGTTQP